MTRMLPLEIFDADIDAYAESGVVCLRGLFNDEWIDHLRGCVDR